MGENWMTIIWRLIFRWRNVKYIGTITCTIVTSIKNYVSKYVLRESDEYINKLQMWVACIFFPPTSSIRGAQ